MQVQGGLQNISKSECDGKILVNLNERFLKVNLNEKECESEKDCESE